MPAIPTPVLWFCIGGLLVLCWLALSRAWRAERLNMNYQLELADINQAVEEVYWHWQDDVPVATKVRTLLKSRHLPPPPAPAAPAAV